MEKCEKKICLELLSPAKDFETGKTALTAGADAVYIGGPDFSARSAAGNSWEDIKDLCDFAHQFYAKVYVVINTIFYNGEEGRIQNSLDSAYGSGADAIIIQDMGILRLDLPPIPVIASTQCHNYSSDHIRFLRDAGFSRVILAREMSLEQIAKIHKEVPDLEIEAFVHGALCVSYSGRCYFSQHLAGRSANRGRCMQVCRLPFDLADSAGSVIEKNKYLLSAKDLNMSGHLKELIDAGVTAFKIEGRLKDAAYAGNITAAYSKELDRIIAGGCGKYSRASSGRVKLSYEPEPDKSFNRTFTKYFYFGRKETVISETGQKSAGEFIGRVKEIMKNFFTLDRGHDIKNGDGLCWSGSDGELDGININTVEGDKIFPNRKMPDRTGTEIYRNENPAFEKAVVSGAERRVSVSADVKESDGKFIVKAEDEDKNRIELQFTHDRTEAKNPEAVGESWKKQFSKTGDTIFELTGFNFSGSNYFVTVSNLNLWRRETLAAMSAERQKNYPRQIAVHSKKIPEYPLKHIDSSYNVSNKYAEDFYKKAGALIVDGAFEISGKDGIVTLMTTKHCIKYHIGACPKCGGLKNFKEPLFLVLNGIKYRLEFDCVKCEMKILK
jgi:23S rRNA 5-hydroxycytidine C2501 synthase